MNDWHLQHLMQLAVGGAGLLMVEATHVERRGRITHHCVGLYNDSNEAALERVFSAASRVAPAGAVIGLQLAHAGRKASSQRPWEGRQALTADQDPWPTVAPSALPAGPGWHTPAALDEAGMSAIRDAFVQAARRAVRIGFRLLELHCAHGYLLHNFLSPLSNRRDDAWGGDAERRMRFPLEVAEAVKAALPAEVALGARITGSDWVTGGIGVDEAIAFAAALKARGLDYVCVSGGGNAPKLEVDPVPGYQVPLAAAVRRATGMVTRAVGLVTRPEQAEAIVAEGHADMVAIGRAFLADPRWAWRAADALGGTVAAPVQYDRARPPAWRP
jgi:2,4-dienoyl-CoA reductase-like NADH-dependent reductase (Old Yellow Enzyme family)